MVELLSGRMRDILRMRAALLVWAALAFTAGGAAAERSQPLSVDLDGDGRLDWLVPDPASARGFAVVLREEGQPSAARKPSSATGPGLVIADWDDDGAPDVFVVRPGMPLALWRNIGRGQFVSDGQFIREFPIPVQSVRLAEFSSSSYPALICRTDSLTVALLERRENEPRLSYWQVPEGQQVTLRDIDGDGRVDLVAGSRVLLRRGDDWAERWQDIEEFARPPAVRVRLIGPPENPDAVGAKVVLRASTGTQTHWVYPPEARGPIEFALPADAVGLLVRWPDGQTATVLAPEEGEYTLRARPPKAIVLSEWSNALEGSHLRWSLESPARPSERPLWTVARTGQIDDPQPVVFDATGREMRWRGTPMLVPGERCILSYAGNPVTVWTKASPPASLLPWPVVRDSLPEGARFAVADGTGDGRLDVLVSTGATEGEAVAIRPLPWFLPALGEPSRFDPERLGHRLWWDITTAAEPKWEEIREAFPWFGGTPPQGIEEGKWWIADVTDDGLPDFLVLRPNGVLEVYQATDGRPSGLHLVGGAAKIGPAGPGEPTAVPLVNPTDRMLTVAEVHASGNLTLRNLPLPAQIAPHDTLWVPILLPEGRHEDFKTVLTVVSEQVYRGRTDVPVYVSVGLAPDAPPVEVELPLGTVQRDSLVRASFRVPWVYVLPEEVRPATVSSGQAWASVSPVSMDEDTVLLRVEFIPLGIGQVELSYPLRRGQVTIRASAVDTVPPPPVHPTMRVAGDTVVLRWSPVGVADVSHYEVLRLGGDAPQRWRVGLDTLWTDTGLPEGGTWRYLVHAVDMVGNRSIADTLSAFRPDRTPPQIAVLDPSDGAVDVDLHRPLVFLVGDSLSGVIPESLRVWVQGRRIPPSALELERQARWWKVRYRPDAWPMGEVIEFTIEAVDSARPPNFARWTGQFTTVADTIIPTVRWTGRPPFLGAGGTVRATVSMPADRELVGASLVVRPAGANAVDSLVGVISGREVEVDIPPALVPFAGLFYRWIIRTDRRTYWWPDRWRSWSLQVPPDGVFWPGSGMQGPGRALLAVPIVTEGDALAHLREDITNGIARARLRTFDAVRQRWTTDDASLPLNVGRAAVMVWDDTAPVVQIDKGHTVPLDSAQTIPLEPRWNLIGQPFPYPISWRRVKAANPDLPIVGPWVERDGLRVSDVWDAWEGAWVYLASPRPAQLVIPAGDTLLADEVPSIREVREPLPKWTATEEGWSDDRAYLLEISVSNGARSLHNLALGWNPLAGDAYDPFDLPMPPSPDSILVAGFRHQEWTDRPGMYATDIRAPAHGGVWRLTIESTVGEPVVLHLNFLIPLPPGFAADVLDVTTRDSLRLDEEGIVYTLRDMARFPLRELVIVVGDESYRRNLEREDVLAPSELVLYQNFPNPFNGETTITYSIPSQADGSEQVRLVIYNMLGQPVRVLYDGPASPGVHSVTWDARDTQDNPLSSGIYFCELMWGQQRRLQRLIYLR